MNKNRQKNKNNRAHKRWLLILGLLVLVAALAITILESTDVIDLNGNKKQTADSTIGQQTKGEPQEIAADEQTPPPNNNSNSKNEVGNGQSQKLRKPSGTFVSNHEPNLSGKPAPNLIESVCVTTPSATCVITFTKDGVTKSLPEQTADAEGATYWTWKLQDHGLTEGDWQVQAQATLGDQEESATDPIKLKVQP